MNAHEAGIDPNLLYEDQHMPSSREDDEVARAIQESLRIEEQNKQCTTSAPPAMTDEEEMMRRVLEESKREYEQLQAMQKAASGGDEEEKALPPKEPIKKAKKEPKKEPTKDSKKEPKKDSKKEPKKEPKKTPKKETVMEPAPKKETPAPIKAPKVLAPIGGSKTTPDSADFDIQKHAEETKKLEIKKTEIIKKQVKLTLY